MTSLPEADSSSTIDAIETSGILRHHRAVIALSVSPLTFIGNSTSALSIIGATVPIPGGLMVPGGHVARLIMGGLLRNTTGASATATFRIMYGSTTLFSTVVTLPNHASDRPWTLDAWFGTISAFGINTTGLSVFHLADPGGSGIDTATYTRNPPFATLDPSITQNLNVTVQFSVANSGIGVLAGAGRLDWSRIR